jgi:hypothetical protein
MQRILSVAALIGVLWALDAFAFQGRYTAALWVGANHQAQIFDNSVCGPSLANSIPKRTAQARQAVRVLDALKSSDARFAEKWPTLCPAAN